MARFVRVERSRRTRLLPLALAFLVGAGIGAASDLAVQRNATLLGFFAESYDLGRLLQISSTSIDVASADSSASGTESLPVEIAETNPPASTPIVRGHWTYTALVQERAADSVSSGTFVVSLTVNGKPSGAVFLVQKVSNSLAREGATVTFDVGSSIPSSALFVLSLREILPPSSTLNITLRTANGKEWVGVGGSIEGKTNPEISAPLGTLLKFRLINGDDGFHNFRIVDLTGNVLAGPTPDITKNGEETTLGWTPSSSGTYRYECQYHVALGMWGRITVP